MLIWSCLPIDLRITTVLQAGTCVCTYLDLGEGTGHIRERVNEHSAPLQVETQHTTSFVPGIRPPVLPGTGQQPLCFGPTQTPGAQGACGGAPDSQAPTTPAGGSGSVHAICWSIWGCVCISGLHCHTR